jgi:hypothetical protein
VDTSLRYVKDFESKYNNDAEEFKYYNSNLEFDDDIKSIKEIITDDDSMFMLFLASQDINLIIPKIYFAVDQIKNYTFYVTDKKLDMR